MKKLFLIVVAAAFAVMSCNRVGPEYPGDNQPVVSFNETGLYLGIVAFNQQIYTCPIRRLDYGTINIFDTFIDTLSATNGTLLYHSVDKALEMIQCAKYPSNLFSASVVTFTDGLDQGSSMIIEDYPGDFWYLEDLHKRLSNTDIAGVGLSAYSIGLMGEDVTNASLFSNNLKKLAVPSANAYEVSSMEAVDHQFQVMAQQMSQKIYNYNLSITIPGPANGTKVRFTLDDVDSATDSQIYIEGKFNLSSRSLTGVTYHGVSSSSGSTVAGVQDGIFVRFEFDGITPEAAAGIRVRNLQQWNYVSSSGKWQKNSELNAENDARLSRQKKSAVVLLNLDCSTSLADEFSTLKYHAQSFVEKLCEAAFDETEVTSITIDKTEMILYEGMEGVLAARVWPETAEDKTILWSSEDESVATVSSNGRVKAVAPGKTRIIATSRDRGLTASCEVTVESLMVDLGLSVKWAKFNLGASSPDDYGDYFAWGETEPHYEPGYAHSDYPVWKEGMEDGYAFTTYKWYDYNNEVFLRYNHDSSYGPIDNKASFWDYNYQDDAARANWGGTWRMPTKGQWSELMDENNCTWTWTTLNGVCGYQVTSVKPGFKGNSIFLPAAGYRANEAVQNDGVEGHYWSGELYLKEPYRAYFSKFFEDDYSSNWIVSRSTGRSVRPVAGPKVKVSCVNLSIAELSLQEGDSYILYPYIEPSTADGTTCIWSSSNESIATVNQRGVVAANGPGNTVISVTTLDGGYMAYCRVSVEANRGVDLGLSVNWASCNLGASSPEQCGDYYAWGEVSPKSGYYWSNYLWCNGGRQSLTKYNFSSSYGWVDYKDVLDLDDDAAWANLGEPWRMPTYSEISELMNNCTYEYTSLGGVAGGRFTSAVPGYTDQSIFIPLCGLMYNRLEYSDYGLYWSSSLSGSSPDEAVMFVVDSDGYYWTQNFDRFLGMPIRPVYDKNGRNAAPPSTSSSNKGHESDIEPMEICPGR